MLADLADVGDGCDFGFEANSPVCGAQAGAFPAGQGGFRLG